MNVFADNIVPFLDRLDRPLTVLTVEDNRLERAFLEEQVKSLGHHVMEAENGHEALEVLRNKPNKIDVILMDRLMPVMDGLSAVRLIKGEAAWRRIPIIMVTGATGEQDIEEALGAGVFYYLAKPVNEVVLRSVLTAAIRESQQTKTLSDELKKHRMSFNLIDSCKFIFRTADEAESLAAFMAHCFPHPDKVLHGLAEIMINAVEHGNLEIGYERKTDLVENNTWRAEIERRLRLPEYQGRTVEAVLTRKDAGIYVVVTDKGRGFDWRRYMRIDPSRAGDNHGRGIAQANVMSFDKLAYNDIGNQAVAFVGQERQLEW